MEMKEDKYMLHIPETKRTGFVVSYTNVNVDQKN